MKKKIFTVKKIHTLLYLFLLAIIALLLYHYYQHNTVLSKKQIPRYTYCANHQEEAWYADSPYGYYLFIDNEENTLEITDFSIKTLFKAHYEYIDNGVFSLSNNQGFVSLQKNGLLRFHFTEEHPLIIFDEFVIFAE